MIKLMARVEGREYELVHMARTTQELSDTLVEWVEDLGLMYLFLGIPNGFVLAAWKESFKVVFEITEEPDTVGN